MTASLFKLCKTDLFLYVVEIFVAGHYANTNLSINLLYIIWYILFSVTRYRVIHFVLAVLFRQKALNWFKITNFPQNKCKEVLTFLHFSYVNSTKPYYYFMNYIRFCANYYHDFFLNESIWNLIVTTCTGQ